MYWLPQFIVHLTKKKNQKQFQIDLVNSAWMKIMIRDPYRIFVYSLQIKKTKQARIYINV